MAAFICTSRKPKSAPEQDLGISFKGDDSCAGIYDHYLFGVKAYNDLPNNY